MPGPLPGLTVAAPGRGCCCSPSSSRCSPPTCCCSGAAPLPPSASPSSTCWPAWRRGVPAWRRHVPAGLLLLALDRADRRVRDAVGRPEGPARAGHRRRRAGRLAVDDGRGRRPRPHHRRPRPRPAASSPGCPTGSNVGLVAFSGTAAVVVPPTTGPRRRRAGAGRSCSSAPAPRSARPSSSSLTALSTVPDAPGLPPPPARVVLLSDGANTQGRPVSTGRRASPRTPACRSRPSPTARRTASSRWRASASGCPSTARPWPSSPTRTDGTAYEAESGDELERVYEDIGSSVGTTVERQEVTDLLAGLGLLLGLAAAATALLWSPRIP